MTVTKPSLINFIKRLLFLVKVEGESGWPELVPEKTYFATSLLKPRVGDFIVFKNPKKPAQILVKKVKARVANRYEVAGDVSWSTSGRDFGVVNNEFILGKLIK